MSKALKNKVKLNDVVSVKDFGAVGDGTTDDTSAIQATITAASPNGKVVFPAGIYKTTSQLLVSSDRVHLEGAGSYATKILFAPTANGTCLKLSAGAAIMSQGSVRGIAFFSDDSTYTKTAIEMIDVDLYNFEDITIAGSVAGAASSYYWSGASSIGLRIRGRDLTGIKGITIFADRPIVISQNPNVPTISIDHFHFSDCYFGANGNPLIEVETGVNLTHVTFDGYQAWVVGTTGFKWIDTTSTIISAHLKFENVRAEQGTDATAYLFDIQHNTALQSPVFNNCYGGSDRRGLRLRKCENVVVKQYFHAGTTEALNIDATVKRLELLECFWQATSTATVTGQRLLFGTPLNPNTAPLPGNAIYDESANAARTVTVDAAISGTVFTLANNATLALGANIGGTVSVVTSEGFGALFALHGSQAVVDLITQAGTVVDSYFSKTAATASKVNLYYSGGQYTIENKRGSSINVKITVLGSYGAI